MKHIKYTDQELKDLAIAVYDCKVFTSLQCKSHEITSCFPILMFMGSPPSPPLEPDYKEGANIKENRKNKLNQISELKQWKIDMKHYNEVTYPEWLKNEKPSIDKFMKNIGFLYESYDKAMPTSINGKPVFFSCTCVSKPDLKRFNEIYKNYCKKREEFDKSF